MPTRFNAEFTHAGFICVNCILTIEIAFINMGRLLAMKMYHEKQLLTMRLSWLMQSRITTMGVNVAVFVIDFVEELEDSAVLAGAVVSFFVRGSFDGLLDELFDGMFDGVFDESFDGLFDGLFD